MGSNGWRPALVTLLSFACFNASSALGDGDTARENPVSERTPGDSPIHFERIDDAFLSLPVRINDKIDTNFILDTGAGVTILDKAISDQLGLQVTGSHSGKRMSGQTIHMDTGHVDSLIVGKLRKDKVPVAFFDLKTLLPQTAEFSKIGGFISLNLLKDTPFTVDYGSSTMAIEDQASLKERKRRGTTVPVKVTTRNRLETGVTLILSICDHEKARVEVDTGSQGLILNTKYMTVLHIDPSDQNLKRSESKDETGHLNTRYYTSLPCRIKLAVAAGDAFSQSNPAVMFQKIIYDGLIGDTFLRQFTVTYDLPHSQIIFARQKQIPSN